MKKEFSMDDIFRLSIEAIEMFIEYRDKHGYDEGCAKYEAAREMVEGCFAEEWDRHECEQ